MVPPERETRGDVPRGFHCPPGGRSAVCGSGGVGGRRARGRRRGGRSAGRDGHHRLLERAALDPGLPGHLVVAPAVVPLQLAGGPADVDDVAAHAEVVEPAGAGNRLPDAAVAAVAVAEAAELARAPVEVLTAVADLYVVQHQLVVVARLVLLDVGRGHPDLGHL